METAKINLFILFASIFICCARSSEIVAPLSGSPPLSQVEDQQNVTGYWLCNNKHKYCVIKPDANMHDALIFWEAYQNSCVDGGPCIGNPPMDLNTCEDPEHVLLVVSGLLNRVYQIDGDCDSVIGQIISTIPCKNNPQYQLPAKGGCKATGTCIWLHCSGQ